VKFLRRLIQPRNPAFWIMLALNGLSAVLLWIAQNYHLTEMARVVIAILALGNCWQGLRLARRLIATPPEPPPQA
jgi:predicted MFS family arabinose efflux permease